MLKWSQCKCSTWFKLYRDKISLIFRFLLEKEYNLISLYNLLSQANINMITTISWNIEWSELVWFPKTSTFSFCPTIEIQVCFLVKFQQVLLFLQHSMALVSPHRSGIFTLSPISIVGIYNCLVSVADIVLSRSMLPFIIHEWSTFCVH